MRILQPVDERKIPMTECITQVIGEIIERMETCNNDDEIEQYHFQCMTLYYWHAVIMNEYIKLDK